MKDTNVLQSEDSQVCSGKRIGLLLLVGFVFAALVLVAFLTVKNINERESALSLIESVLNQNEQLLDNTNDVDENLEELPDDFLSSEAVSTEVVDSSLSELDQQIDDLDNLEDDFTLESSDVGL